MNQKYLVIFAGPNGSGKSTIADGFLFENPMLYICPDNYAKKFDFIKFTFNRYYLAMIAAELARVEAVQFGNIFAIETVFSNPDKLQFIKFARENGYSIIVLFVTTSDPQINVARVKQRVLQGGHDVLEEKILARYHKSMMLLPDIVAIADEVSVYDNSDLNGPVKLIFEKNKLGCRFLLNDDELPLWCESLRHFVE